MVDVDDFIAKARDPKTMSVIMRKEKAEALADEIERLRTALRQADCPYKIEPDDGTVGSCVDSGHCGCCLGEPLMPRAMLAAVEGDGE